MFLSFTHMYTFNKNNFQRLLTIASDHRDQLPPPSLPCQVPIVGSNMRHQLEEAAHKQYRNHNEPFSSLILIIYNSLFIHLISQMNCMVVLVSIVLWPQVQSTRLS